MRFSFLERRGERIYSPPTMSIFSPASFFLGVTFTQSTQSGSYFLYSRVAPATHRGMTGEAMEYKMTVTLISNH